MKKQHSKSAKTNTGTKSRQGAALIEMALVLPILVVIVLICVDLGRFASVYTAVTNAAREGANFGGTHPFTSNTYARWRERVEETASDEMDDVPSFDQDSFSVSEPELIASNKRSRVRVEVTYTFRPAIVWPVLPKQMVITRHAEMPVIR